MNIFKCIFAFVMLTILFTASSSAVAGDIPTVMSYHSVMYDDGGNPIPDGDTGVSFRILDADGNVLYEESQTVVVSGGMISALIGNGINSDGASTGGIDPSIFESGDPRFLDVQLDGYPAVGPAEIASLPYAMYSKVAYGVSDGVINTKSIADGGIEFKDLSDKLVDELKDKITGGGDIALKSDIEDMYRSPDAASKIGVRRGMNYSGASDLQSAISDLDRAVKRRDDRLTSEIENRKTADASEISARKQADTNEAALRQSADANLQNNINSESSTRQSADANLQNNINGEKALRQSADINLQQQIDDKMSKSGGSIKGDVDLGGHRMENVGAPNSDDDAVSKGYVSGSFLSIPSDSPSAGVQTINLSGNTEGSAYRFVVGQGDPVWSWDIIRFSATVRGLLCVQFGMSIISDFKSTAWDMGGGGSCVPMAPANNEMRYPADIASNIWGKPYITIGGENIYVSYIPPSKNSANVWKIKMEINDTGRRARGTAWVRYVFRTVSSAMP